MPTLVDLLYRQKDLINKRSEINTHYIKNRTWTAEVKSQCW